MKFSVSIIAKEQAIPMQKETKSMKKTPEQKTLEEMKETMDAMLKALKIMRRGVEDAIQRVDRIERSIDCEELMFFTVH